MYRHELEAMVSEVAASDELYRPSRFWKDMNEINQAMIDELGLENLKRTLAQNYFNWLIISKRDPQVSFNVRDPIDGIASRGDWGGTMPGSVRPNLIWTTEKIS